MESLRLALAILIPGIVGAMLWTRLCGATAGPGRLSLLLGGALLLGMLIAALLARLLVNVTPQHSFWVGTLCLCLFPALIAATGPLKPWLPSPGLMRWPGLAPPGWQRWLIAALIAILLLRGVHLALEVYWRPIFPWDAWSAWAIKARYWFMADEALQFAAANEWAVMEPGTLRYNPAWHYPALLPALQLWMVSAFGSWHEPAANLPWLLLWLSLGLLVYGYLRDSGLQAWSALLASYVLLSLPLLNAHVALAGYADLWLAVVLCAATLALQRWVLSRQRGWLLLGLGLALLLPGIKLEGGVWLLCLLTAVILSALPARWRWPALLLSVLALALLLSLASFSLPLPGLGMVSLQAGAISIPGYGDVVLRWQPVAGAVISALLLSSNWHLLWYLLPLVMLTCWRQVADSRHSFLPAAVLVLGAGFLGVLFFLTDASRWAEDHTSFSRLVLHLVPLMVCWMALLVGRYGDAQSVPGLGQDSGEALPAGNAQRETSAS